jgi:ElaB/YqjD/DUF883 family membrane-anchored ribosome-binding protein
MAALLGADIIAPQTAEDSEGERPMDPQPDAIRPQINETRSSLTEKLETLEAEVLGTVRCARSTVATARDAVAETLTSARETVQETLSSVQETVQSAGDAVKRTFDIPYQVDRHPWVMLGLSLVSGAIAGALLGGPRTAGERLSRRLSELSRRGPAEPGESMPAAARSRPAPPETGRPGFMDRLAHNWAARSKRSRTSPSARSSASSTRWLAGPSRPWVMLSRR